jgi:hypothetical protein
VDRLPGTFFLGGPAGNPLGLKNSLANPVQMFIANAGLRGVLALKPAS